MGKKKKRGKKKPPPATGPLAASTLAAAGPPATTPLHTCIVCLRGGVDSGLAVFSDPEWYARALVALGLTPSEAVPVSAVGREACAGALLDALARAPDSQGRLEVRASRIGLDPAERELRFIRVCADCVAGSGFEAALVRFAAFEHDDFPVLAQR